MTTLSLKLPEAVHRRLRALARSRGVSKSELVREAIESLMHAGQSLATDDSFAVAAADLAGCAEGPKDLSTHPKHMVGYGR